MVLLSRKTVVWCLVYVTEKLCFTILISKCFMKCLVYGWFYRVGILLYGIIIFQLNYHIGLKNISVWMIDNRLRKVNPVSVKIFQPERASSVTIEQKKKFQREVMLLSRIQHENIVQVN